ncbi:MAG: UvrD-helicase domain-containing protein [Verrucomicrobia bacterium]|nr:UvrD-helicase domain-containing protein [Verrucomicrobiota bacterium]
MLAAGRTYAGALLHDFIQSGQQALGRLLSERQARTYHALLSQVADVLRSEAGERVASALATQYPAALIDEFQDTDPLQFEIFNRVFGRADCRLWMVGDPKQAIYGFRGADVFTYLEARTRVDGGRVYSLPGNRRSDSRLVTAVNLLFDWPRSFLVNGIAYAPVEARSDVDQRRLEEAGNRPRRFVSGSGPGNQTTIRTRRTGRGWRRPLPRRSAAWWTTKSPWGSGLAGGSSGGDCGRRTLPCWSSGIGMRTRSKRSCGPWGLRPRGIRWPAFLGRKKPRICSVCSRPSPNPRTNRRFVPPWARGCWV